MVTRGRRRCRDRRLERGDATKYVRPIETVGPGDKVVVFARVSAGIQRRQGNLDDQVQNLMEVVAERGATVVGVVPVVGNGHDGADHLWGLMTAARLAEQHGAVIVAESVSRLMRHPGYHSSQWPDAQARESDLATLYQLTSPASLVSVVRPDASAAEERSYARRRGQQQKGNLGGRPTATKPRSKAKRRMALQPVAQRCHRNGLSLGEVADLLEVPRSTVQDWVRH